MKIQTGVPASVQQSSYQNATLQSDDGMRIAYSIATYVRVPTDVGVRGEKAVRDFLARVLRDSEFVTFDVVVGKDDDADDAPKKKPKKPFPVVMGVKNLTEDAALDLVDAMRAHFGWRNRDA